MFEISTNLEPENTYPSSKEEFFSGKGKYCRDTEHTGISMTIIPFHVAGDESGTHQIWISHDDQYHLIAGVEHIRLQDGRTFYQVQFGEDLPQLIVRNYFAILACTEAHIRQYIPEFYETNF